MKDHSTPASYISAFFAIIAGLTLTDVGIIIGIVTAILTMAVNWFYRHQEYKIESAKARAEIAAWETRTVDRRQRDIPVSFDRRRPGVVE